jgi:MFS family permease
MDDFENIQKNWLSQPIEQKHNEAAVSSVQNKWITYQRKSKLSTWLMTAGFLVAFIVITWVYFTFREKYRWPFDASIAIAILLMIIFLFVKWRSYGFEKKSMDVPEIEFINNQIKKLSWDKKILTKYLYVYNLLLWLALCLYTIEVTRKGTLLFTLTALGITTAYIFGVTLWARFYKQKKQIAVIDDLISDLNAMLKEMK